MARHAMAWSRARGAIVVLGLLALGLRPVAGYMLDITSQPLCGSIAGLPLEQQPAVRVLLSDGSELVDGMGSWTPGEQVARGLQQQVRRGIVVDVLARGQVSVSFGMNPVGATFGGGDAATMMMMKDGVAMGGDLNIVGGGTGFTLMFTFTARDGSVMSAESEPFMCLGQSAALKIARQPRLQLPGAVGVGISIQPIVTVVDSYGHLVPGADPAITVSIAINPAMAELTAGSTPTVRALHGSAAFESLQLTRAASRVEASVPAYEDQTTLTALRFSAPGFRDVVSEAFEVLPLVVIGTQPYSDKSRTITASCSGTVDGCVATLSSIVGVEADRGSADAFKLEKLQSAKLDVFVTCTDLDGAGEAVALFEVGGRTVPTSDYSTGPWADCAFAGCRGECGSNMRPIVSGLDVKMDLGALDPVSGVYITGNTPLPIKVALTDKVDICPCNGTALTIEVALTITYSILRNEQGLPLVVQPQVLLQNTMAEPYSLHAKEVTVDFLVNPARATLTGRTTLLSVGGVAQFTDVALSEAGTGFVLRFSIENGAGNTTFVDSAPFNVGRGNLPIMQLTEKPAASARNIGRALRTPPLIELKRMTGGVEVNTQSDIEVAMVIGTNGPDGEIDGATETLLRADPFTGEVLFLNVLLLNGNCADCEDPPEGPGKCGLGYSLVFVSNDVKIESDLFNVAGGNRSPRWIAPTPAHNIRVPAVSGEVTRVTTINVTDDNLHSIHVALGAPASVAADLSIATYFCPWDEAAVKTLLCVGPGVAAAGGSNFDLLAQYQTWGQMVQLIQQGTSGCVKPLTVDRFGYGTPVTMTPKCKLAAQEYPGPRSSVPLCFQPADEFEVDTRPVYTRGDERCVDVEVLAAAAPVLTAPYHWNAHHASLEGIAPGVLAAHAALPDMGGVREYSIGVGCVLEFDVAGMDARGASSLEMLPLRTTVTTLYSQRELDTPLPAGAVLGATSGTNPATAAFRWQPERGMEGRKYTICFFVRSTVEAGCVQDFYVAPYHGHASQFCVEVSVERCRVCARPGETLASIAEEYRTSVNQVWGGNVMRQAQHLAVGQVLDFGPTYEVGHDETLAEVAAKLATPMEHLFALNPDLRERRAALSATPGEALRASKGNYEPGTAPWAMQAGTMMPDAQSLCFTPPICSYEALPTASSPDVAAFQCEDCDGGREYCTAPRCVAGVGAGPWEDAACSRFVGRRCQRCTACRTEEVGPAGDITVPGEYRAAGCDGEVAGGVCEDCTADAVCQACTVCAASQVEVRKCTPLQDRVCARAGAPGAAFLPE
mmetsp:Transcript_12707/g.30860  ORF Transcript_12707/g.30860 Transcript_12707/m.30860 type:complete len:1287 (+) Transcript_12707:45-3905(+)